MVKHLTLPPPVSWKFMDGPPDPICPICLKTRGPQKVSQGPVTWTRTLDAVCRRGRGGEAAALGNVGFARSHSHTATLPLSLFVSHNLYDHITEAF